MYLYLLFLYFCWFLYPCLQDDFFIYSNRWEFFGWMDGWMDGWMHWETDRRTDGRTALRTDGEKYIGNGILVYVPLGVYRHCRIQGHKGSRGIFQGYLGVPA